MFEKKSHGEWLSLLEVSGPFLAETVLEAHFPQGLDELDPLKKKLLRQAYDEWREAQDVDDPQFSELHRAWIELVLKRGLELDEDDDGDVLKPASLLGADIKFELPEHDVTIEPDYAVVTAEDKLPSLLIQTLSAGADLGAVSKGDGWAASPVERMVCLCRTTKVRLGLLTNGERWMLIDAPEGGVTTYASWYSRLWGQEPVTLQAFVNLLGIRRFFLDSSQQLPALLDESLKHQDEVTDALGDQVRRAVEVLVQALDKADQDRGRELLREVEPAELYEAGLTVMMRLVFLLSAEERDLLLLGDERYEAYYAVSTLRMQLREQAGLHSEEILSHRRDAWSRLLAIFRAVYGGVEHETLRMPALGGSLFDPDRFPFLEGRAKGSDWRHDPSQPLPIDNRTVLLLLDAIQLFQGRTLSYRALDVEQIGYVYEGLLERTVVRAKDVTLELKAGKAVKQPWITWGELEDARMSGEKAIEKLLSERTGSKAIKSRLQKVVSDADKDKLLTACQGNQELRDRLVPYYHFLRIDPWGYPLIYPKGAFMVATGTDRRETGTHYTPKSLTEAIVKETLEPVVYIGPAEGHERQDWQLKSPSELLDLKICDLAMGSGAFLVQVCRWLSERLMEAWAQAEAQGKSIRADGVVVDQITSQEPLTADTEERFVTARRLISERCLYGVDVNPLAVELAKLSIWLVTLAKGRPFGFLDHNLRHGDSLLGITDLDQLHYLDMKVGKGSEKKLFAQKIDEAVKEAIELRMELRQRPILDIRDVEVMAHLDQKAREKLELPELVADALVGETLKAGGKKADVTMLSIEAGQAFEGEKEAFEALRRRAQAGLNTDLPSGKQCRKALHWCLEFPEVFLGEKHGFDAVVGNPPFKRGHDISKVFGESYRGVISELIANGNAGRSDFCSFFVSRSFSLILDGGSAGLIATKSISEGDSRKVAFENEGYGEFHIKWALPNMRWPGAASVFVSPFVIKKGFWCSKVCLTGVWVDRIGSSLKSELVGEIRKLDENKAECFVGSYLRGDGFVVSEEFAHKAVDQDSKYASVIFKYINGVEFNSNVCALPNRYAISFWDFSEEQAKKFPVCYQEIANSVKLERINATRKNHRERWWLYAENRPGLYHSVGMGEYFTKHPKKWPIYEYDRVIAKAKTSNTWAFGFLPINMIYDQALTVIASGSYAILSILQSSVHELWARCADVSSKHENRLRYSSTTYETYPFPNLGDSGKLSELGERYHRLRMEIMDAAGYGLTPLCHDFHDPLSVNASISELRTLHTKIDEELLVAYGWSDIELNHGFYEVDYLPEGENIRYTICDSARHELLSRLVLLNGERCETGHKSLKPSGSVVSLEQYKKAPIRDLSLDSVAEPKPQMDIFGQEDE